LSKIPVVAQIVSTLDLLPIPIYLNPDLTGLTVDSEDKSIEIETANETLPNADAPVTNQKGIQSTVRITMIANRNSLGVSLLAALMDVVFEKVTSREYSITYLNGAVTVFNGLLHSFSIKQSADNELMDITLELTKGSLKATPLSKIPKVGSVTGNLPL
jgi:hypothetical protein